MCGLTTARTVTPTRIIRRLRLTVAAGPQTTFTLPKASITVLRGKVARTQGVTPQAAVWLP